MAGLTLPPEALSATPACEFGLENDRFVFIKELQRGGQGEVHVCKRLCTGNEYAVKVINRKAIRRHPRNEVHLRREIRTLRELQHKHIVNLLAAFWDEGNCFIVMDLAREGDLSQKVERGRGLDGGAPGGAEYASRYVARQLLAGLQYMHTRRVIHRDMKIENVLIWSSRPATEPLTYNLYSVKIADFGLSTWRDIEGELLTPVGTPVYVAPEILRNRYDERVDHFSFGVVLYVMLCGDFPFDRSNANQATLEEAQIQETYAWDQVSLQGKQVVQGLLVVDPDKRLNPGSCLAHPWFAIEELDGKGFERQGSEGSGISAEPCGAVAQISGWIGAAVDNVTLHMRGGTTAFFGQEGGFCQTMHHLKPGETIIAVAQETRVMTPEHLGNALVFYTSECGIVALKGSDARTRRRIVAPADSQIVGLQFHGPNLEAVYLERASCPGAVASISGATGSAVDRVELELRDGTKRKYGKDAGSAQGPWMFREDEMIVAVEQARRDAHLGNSIAFYTSAGRVYKLVGMESSWSRRFSAAAGSQICGLVFDGSVLTHVRTCARHVAFPRPHEIEQHEAE